MDNRHPRGLANSTAFGEKRQVPLDKQITFGITFKDPLTVKCRNDARISRASQLNRDGNLSTILARVCLLN